MTDQELLHIARDADKYALGSMLADGVRVGDFQRALVAMMRAAAQAEREACAMICGAPHWKIAVRNECQARAAAIRARSNVGIQG